MSISLYIHFPWCIKKCPYCDFNSHEGFSDDIENVYINSLQIDLQNENYVLQNREISTIFMGGGTPSLFSSKSLSTLINYIYKNYKLSKDVEITIEANPGTFEIDKFTEYKQIGINRLSLGIQSFNEEHLKKLGRIHDSKSSLTAAEKARTIFDNCNFDIIYALPNQTSKTAFDDINTALSFNPDHLSCYELTIEKGTVFFSKPPPALLNNDEKAGMSEQLIDLLDKKGFIRYEVSAFANNKITPQKQCLHNLNYWQFGDYIGIGAGAHSKITLPDKIIRKERIKLPQSYINNTLVDFQKNIITKTVDKQDIALEFLMNALRLKNGFTKTLFTKKTNMSITSIAKPLNRAKSLGLITITADKIIPTKFGFNNLNYLLELFI